MKFFNRISILVFLTTSAAILCFSWISDWQMPARADNMVLAADLPAAISLPGTLRESSIYPKLRPSDGRAKAYYNRGTAYYKKTNFDSAIQYLSMSIALEPKAPDAYFNRGLSYRRQHKNDEALSDFSKAIDLNQTQAGYYFERCNVLIVKNDLKGAIADCSEALRLSLDDSTGYLMRGVAHLLRGDLDEALADSVQVLQIDPDYRDARRLLFETLLKKEAVNQTAHSTVPHQSVLENIPAGMFSVEKT
jgi:tetratricopeptide (TPR) repeat protein